MEIVHYNTGFVSRSSAGDLIEAIAASGAGFAVRRVHVSMRGSTTNQQPDVRLKRMITPTSGSGGTAGISPSKANALVTYDASLLPTVDAHHTTAATAVTEEVIEHGAWPIQGGWFYRDDDAEALIIAAGEGFVVDFTQAITAAELSIYLQLVLGR